MVVELRPFLDERDAKAAAGDVAALKRLGAEVRQEIQATQARLLADLAAGMTSVRPQSGSGRGD